MSSKVVIVFDTKINFEVTKEKYFQPNITLLGSYYFLVLSSTQANNKTITSQVMQVGTHGLANAIKQVDVVACLDEVKGQKTPGFHLLD